MAPGREERRGKGAEAERLRRNLERARGPSPPAGEGGGGGVDGGGRGVVGEGGVRSPSRLSIKVFSFFFFRNSSLDHFH